MEEWPLSLGRLKFELTPSLRWMHNSAMSKQSLKWRKVDGDPVACTEKLKVLEQNLDEFRALAVDFLEDAAIMGCDVEQVRRVLTEALTAIPAPYPKKR